MRIVSNVTWLDVLVSVIYVAMDIAIRAFSEFIPVERKLTIRMFYGRT